MSLVSVAYTQWTTDGQVPVPGDGWNLRLDSNIATGFSSGLLYKLIVAETVTGGKTFGYTVYNIAAHAATTYIDLKTYFSPNFDADTDAVFSFKILPNAFESFGKDILFIIHTLGGVEMRMTLIDAAAGAVLLSQVITSDGGGRSHFADFQLLASIGSAPTSWYSIARTAPFSLGAAGDNFSILEIGCDGSSASVVEHLYDTSISSGKNLLNVGTWRADSDGVSYWCMDAIAPNPQIHYIKFAYPWASPVFTAGLISYTGTVVSGVTSPVRIKDALYHKYNGTEYLVVSTEEFTSDVLPPINRADGYSFTSATGAYSPLYSSVLPVSSEFFKVFSAENCLGVYNGNARYKGLTTVLVESALTSVPNNTMELLCIPDGEVVNAKSVLDPFVALSISRDIRINLLAVEGATPGYFTEQIESSTGMGLFSICSGEYDGGGGGGGSNVTATLVASIGLFGSGDGTGPVGLTIVGQPCAIVGGSETGRCITGFSSVPPGISQVLWGRPNVESACNDSSVTASVGSASGTGSSSAVGSGIVTINDADGFHDGASAVFGVGAAIASGLAAAAGLGAANGRGDNGTGIWAATGATAGIGAALAIGSGGAAGITSAVASAVGTGAMLANGSVGGSGVILTIASAAGTGAAAASGKTTSLAVAIARASGLGLASAAGRVFVAAAANANGTGATVATGTSTAANRKSAKAAAHGVGGATAISARRITGVGTARGRGRASGVS